VLIAAAIPAALGVVALLSINLGWWSPLLQPVEAHLGCAQAKMGCLGQAIIAVLLLSIALAVLAAPVMRVAGLRPAWPTAIAGPVVALAVGQAYAASPLAGALSLPGLSLGLVLAVSYAAAAVLTGRGTRYYVRIGVTTVLVVLVAVSAMAG
jgi:hypothetical protein